MSLCSSVEAPVRNPRPDVSVESQPNANSAGKFHNRAGGGNQEVKEKTPSVFPAGMLMDGLTCGGLVHGLVVFLGRSGYVRCVLCPFVLLVTLLVTRVLVGVVRICYPSLTKQYLFDTSVFNP